ncbi:MAG: DUF305 domain-containing protein [Bacteroidota bacterium]
MPDSRPIRFLILLGVLPLAACASSGPATVEAGPARAEPSRAEAASDLEALYWARQDSARSRFTEADVDFMTGMIGHHAQALIMSRLAPENGANPAVQRLAARIINAQRDEIETMQRWLRARDQPVPEVQIEGLVLTIEMSEPVRAMGQGMDHEGMDHGGMDHGGMDHEGMDHGGMSHGSHDHAGMPGMLTQTQLEELAAARGVEFDRLFLAYMIQHHQGAVIMVDDLFAVDGAATDDGSFKLASEIRAEQTTEIAMMQQMLDALPAP